MAPAYNRSVSNPGKSLLVCASVIICSFWCCASWLNMYAYQLTGVFAEIAWFPSIIISLWLVITCCIRWAHQKFKLASLYLFCILLFTATILSIVLL